MRWNLVCPAAIAGWLDRTWSRSGRPPVVAVVERDVILVAFAHRGGRCAFAWLGFTRDVAGATDVERRVLGHSAIHVAGRARRVVHVGGHALLLGRQESGGAGRRQVEVQVEAEVSALVGLLGVSVGQTGTLQDRNARRQKDEELLEIVPVGDADLVEAGQIVIRIGRDGCSRSSNARVSSAAAGPSFRAGTRRGPASSGAPEEMTRN